MMPDWIDGIRQDEERVEHARRCTACPPYMLPARMPGGRRRHINGPSGIARNPPLVGSTRPCALLTVTTLTDHKTDFPVRDLGDGISGKYPMIERHVRHRYSARNARTIRWVLTRSTSLIGESEPRSDKFTKPRPYSIGMLVWTSFPAGMSAPAAWLWSS
jgi:hypothetical protein